MKRSFPPFLSKRRVVSRLVRVTGFLLAASLLTASSPATSITGGGQTVESTPTPEKGFEKASATSVGPSKSSDMPSAYPLPTPNEIMPLTEVKREPAKPAEKTPSSQLMETSASSDQEEFVQLMQAAAENFKKRNFEEALKKIQKAEALKPHDADVMNFRGAVFAETGQFPEARELYLKAQILQPESLWPPFNLGEIEFMQHRYGAAREQFEKTLEKFPDNELLRFKIVLTYLKENNLTAAKSELDRFHFPSETAAYYFAWAAWEFARGNEKAGNDWIDSGVRIFGRERTDFVYESLADLKFVPLPRP